VQFPALVQTGAIPTFFAEVSLNHWAGRGLRMTPDGIDPGMKGESGWTNNVDPQHSWPRDSTSL
jgi:hypothetical protein